MADITKLVVRLEAESSDLRKELDKVDKKLGQFNRNSKRHLDSFGSLVTKTFGLLAAGGIARGIFTTIRQTEVLNASLKTATGSTDAAAKAFKDLEEFAAKTPYALEQSVEAFIKLKNLGLDPSQAALESYGNTAAAMGKDLSQLIEAVADATTGEFERLKEFGIKAKSEGDKVTFTFRGVSKTIKKEAGDIERYLQDIGNVEFAGAMVERAETLDGALSNLGDSFAALARSIGDAGLTEALDIVARKISEIAGAIPDAARAIAAGFKSPVGLGDDKDGVIARMAVLRKEYNTTKRQFDSGKFGDVFSVKLVAISSEMSFLENKLKRLQNPNFERDLILGPLLDDEPKPQDIPGSGGSASGKKAGAGKSAAQRESEQFAKSLQSLRDKLNPAEAETREYMESVALLDRAWAEGLISGEKHADLMNRLATDVDAVREAEEKLTSDRERARELIKGLDPGSTYRDQILEVQRLRDELGTIAPALADSLGDVELELNSKWEDMRNMGVEAAEDTKDAWQDLGPVFTSAFEDAIVGGAKFSDVLKGLEQDILRIITRKAVTEPLGNAVSSLFSGAGGTFSKLFGFASGGSFTVGGSGGTDSQLVAFKATPNERVTVETPGQRSAPKTIIQNFNFPAADMATFQRNRGQMARAAREAIGAA